MKSTTHTNNTADKTALRTAGTAQDPQSLHGFAQAVLDQCNGDLNNQELRSYLRFRSQKVLTDWQDPVAALRASNERMKAALERIAAVELPCMDAFVSSFMGLQHLAKSALSDAGKGAAK